MMSVLCQKIQCVCIALFCWLAITLISGQAAQFKRQAQYTLTSPAIESNELWVAADSITISGQMEQAFFGAARTANLNGVFGQDIWLLAERLEGSPFVRQNVRLAAKEDIHFEGRCDGNLMAFAGDMIEIGGLARVGGNALIMAPKVILSGHIEGNVRVLASQLIVAGRIDGDIDARPGHINVLPGAQIGGQIRHRDDSDPGERARLVPRVRRSRPVEPGIQPVRREWVATGWLGQVYLFGATLLGGLFFLVLLPEYAGRSVRCVRSSFWKSFLAGAIWFIFIPLGILLVALTLIGLPLALVLALLYGILLYASRMIVALALGGILLRRRGVQSFGTATIALLLGLLFLYLGVNVPIIGPWITWIVMLSGFGALLLAMRPAPLPATSPPPLPISEQQHESKPPLKLGE